MSDPRFIPPSDRVTRMTYSIYSSGWRIGVGGYGRREYLPGHHWAIKLDFLRWGVTIMRLDAPVESEASNE